MWPFNASLSPRGPHHPPPHAHASLALPLLAIKAELSEPPVSAPTMEDVLDPDLAARALGQFLLSPEPHDLYEIVSCRPVDPAAMNSSSPLSVCDLSMPSLSPMSDECLSEWLGHHEETYSDECGSDSCTGEDASQWSLSAAGQSAPSVESVTDQPLSSPCPADHEDRADERDGKGEGSERLRKRQRLYEKKYRNRKKGELKRMRKEWLEMEVELLVARRTCAANAVFPVHHQALDTLETNGPTRDRAEILRRNQLLAALNRALLLDKMALSALGAFHRVAQIREYTDKDVLRSRREWQHSTSKIFGPHAKLAPHRPQPLHFNW